ncbi:aspartyl-phosphate phosphatase Spo0E family protein [Alkalihalobacillus sp. MEB130]|uniref:aspartyl-phosphate phosphatase Spo0E family protein n=1 Tax=Alkalihalobacillus sp. MEB130 TaxID=2976704 RepID=UPI0028DE0822|nr:aspartyl-phosphate phosphatase Spo0E family protein [Alkalihalobacillus sp. MEB130]MDT8862348.1 aspartyl-phosphate phosphatase Spo0E family protein [Alkalihalobacillus sp. MEB130]
MIEFFTDEKDVEIELTRHYMIEVGLEYGLTHPYTIEISKKLDELLNNFSWIK